MLASRPTSLAVDGVRLECRWWGEHDAGGSVIVLLHEGLGSVAMWKDFPERLARTTGRAVFVYSRQGYGQSDPLPARREPDYMHREGDEVLPKVLAAAGIERPVLLGHSDGGSIALIYASRFPEDVAGLVLMAPHVFVEPLTVESIAKARTMFLETDLASKLARYHRDAGHVFWGWNDIWLDPRFLFWNIEARLAHVACPVLVLQGEDDEYGTSAQIDSIVAGAARAEAILLERCGHSPHRDREDEVLALTARFVATLTP